MRRLEESDTSQLRSIAKSDLDGHPAQWIVLEHLELADRYAGGRSIAHSAELQERRRR